MEIATSSATVIQNSNMTQWFTFTGMIFWGAITAIGVLTVVNKTFRSFVPKKVKNLK